MKRTLLSLAGSLAPLLAHAGCEDHVQAWARQLHPARTFDSKMATCKVWPANAALTIAALPFGNAEDKDGGGSVDLEVLVADTATGAIVAHQFQPAAIRYEADHGLDGVEIDTARYQLTSAQRAFGVRVKSSGGMPADMSGFETLSLFMIVGPHLHTVLDRMEAITWTGERDGPCVSTVETTRSIALGPVGPQSYAALRVNEKYVERELQFNGQTCSEKSMSAKPRNFTLNYRDGTYRIPDDLRHSN
ncbi:conserved exported hypothetical protein [Paraburkholderia tropica]|uniref:hypothetical protein n=1 Tax=Paraburkholderia tropica TaxID=92647 RepID=UPI001CB2D688|nr:hypothetical protein [Paraburkholderia tropica]CAG9197657.1 conserved exported hypothetical protein [Paraburkholderia tropica]